MEERELTQGGQRIKFHAERLGSIEDFFKDCIDPNDLDSVRSNLSFLSNEMADKLFFIEKMGLTPLLPDKQVGGNAAAILEFKNMAGSNRQSQAIVVSKSGKLSGKMDPSRDVVIVTRFSLADWEAYYYSCDETTKPTSDTPMHWFTLCGRASDTTSNSPELETETPEVKDQQVSFAALTEIARVTHGRDSSSWRSHWRDTPKVCIHGHALCTEAEAKKYKIPISLTETLFSTPEDTLALLQLFSTNVYPDNKIFARKGHGFNALGPSFDAVFDNVSCVFESHR